MDPAALDGPSLWQVGAALAAVLGLVVVAMKGLQRLQGLSGGEDDVRLLSVRRLGPRREVQRLRVGEAVHTIYRHDGAMVVLAQEPWRETVVPAAPVAGGTGSAGQRLRALAAAAGGRVREASGR